MAVCRSCACMVAWATMGTVAFKQVPPSYPFFTPWTPHTLHHLSPLHTCAHHLLFRTHRPQLRPHPLVPRYQVISNLNTPPHQHTFTPAQPTAFSGALLHVENPDDHFYYYPYFAQPPFFRPIPLHPILIDRFVYLFPARGGRLSLPSMLLQLHLT